MPLASSTRLTGVPIYIVSANSTISTSAISRTRYPQKMQAQPALLKNKTKNPQTQQQYTTPVLQTVWTESFNTLASGDIKVLRSTSHERAQRCSHCSARMGHLESLCKPPLWRLSRLRSTKPRLSRSCADKGLAWAGSCTRHVPEVPSDQHLFDSIRLELTYFKVHHI